MLAILLSNPIDKAATNKKHAVECTAKLTANARFNGITRNIRTLTKPNAITPSELRPK